MKTLFSSELDFFTKLLSFACVIFIAIEILYMVLPRSLQRKLEALDYVPRKDGGFFDFSSTAALAGMNGIILAVTIIQKASQYKLSKEEKAVEGRIEREFRHRTMFLMDMHIY